MIKVAMTSVYVDDVAGAHAFCTGVLGFETRTRTDQGDGTLLVTVGAAEGAQRDPELPLEPGRDPLAEPYRRAVRETGLPVIVFSVTDLRAEYERLRGEGVAFVQEPQDQGPVLTAVLDDTVGDLVRLAQSGEE
ncbi:MULTISPECIES: VOC family protein [unclassified Streptomyces]|uniref:VOC family protein n=1 Tax=unclassified Streptomyces TaxID=2593676 RepID=UPI0007859AD2|nr:VOC family protein [Streptomyces sp. AVP053U2]